MKRFCLIIYLLVVGSLLHVYAETKPKDLPEVLIIGDSISLAYTPFVKTMLKGKAEVVHHKGNAGPTIRGVKHIEAWLGETEWDVIHFNFGLWDMYGWEYAAQDRSTKAYQERLEKLVQRLQKTGAVLIWGTTTPACPEPEKTMRRRFNSEVVISEKLEKQYLEAAASVMKKHNIEVNDLHGVIKPRLKEFALAPNDVHFNKAGSKLLGRQVAKAIEHHLTSLAK